MQALDEKEAFVDQDRRKREQSQRHYAWYADIGDVIGCPQRSEEQVRSNRPPEAIRAFSL